MNDSVSRTEAVKIIKNQKPWGNGADDWAAQLLEEAASKINTMPPFVGREFVMMLKGVAYNLWHATLCAGPKSISDLFNELKDPVPGDIVMETSTHLMPNRDPAEGIGRLIKITQEPVYSVEEWRDMGGEKDEPPPTESVYTIALIFDDGREFRWRNASFIKVKTMRDK